MTRLTRRHLAILFIGLGLLFLAYLYLSLTVGVAHAETGLLEGTPASERPAPSLLLPSGQTAVLLLGSLVPLATYLLNTRAPWVDEKVKALVVVLVSAVVAGVYQAIELNDVGFNSHTLQLVLTSVIAALGAHKLLYLPSGISAKLGGGYNKNNGTVSDPATLGTTGPRRSV
jgi:uncharacterized membrane protein SirB2